MLIQTYIQKKIGSILEKNKLVLCREQHGPESFHCARFLSRQRPPPGRGRFRRDLCFLQAQPLFLQDCLSVIVLHSTFKKQFAFFLFHAHPVASKHTVRGTNGVHRSGSGTHSEHDCSWQTLPLSDHRQQSSLLQSLLRVNVLQPPARVGLGVGLDVGVEVGAKVGTKVGLKLVSEVGS